ncbi:dynamin-binding protein [Tetranychus urticae]|uniref:Uncharacterized protein n=1 Tax=Tetranychus urticae TaxID=32264 RepID=T1KA03_TETUR|nr:dynamin-binding protein [Tetranychus urticae]
MHHQGESNSVEVFSRRFVPIQEDATAQENSTQQHQYHTYENQASNVSQFASAISVSRSSTPLVNEINDLPPSYEESIRSDSSSTKNLSIDGIQSYAKVIFPFNARRDDELSLIPGEIVHLIQYADAEENWILGEIDGRIGMFPKDFVKIIVDCMDRRKAASLVVFDYPPDTYGRVLFNFDAEFEGEISVKEGSTVLLLRGFNNDWVEVIDDSGTEGIIPLNHVEVIDTTLPTNTHQIDSTGLNQNTNLLEFSPDEPEVSPLTQDVERLSLNSTSQPGQYSNAEAVSPAHLNSILTPARPCPPVPRHPLPTSKSPPLITPSPRTSSLGLPPSPSPQVPIRTSSNVQSTPLPARVTDSSNRNSGAEAVTKTGGDDDRTEARRKKMMEQRSCIVTEMLQSERDYCQDLRVCVKTFLHDATVKNQLIEKGVVLESLFCNFEEIITVSEKLTRSLEESTLCRKPENQMIGKCFLTLQDEMKQAYIVYCRDHEDVPTAWKRYEENPEIRVILQRGLDRIKSETNCFDVPSLLIKPVQRILKYPLLLNELLKCTDETHPDRDDIIKAAHMITDMAQDINELKRRKDLVFKYRKGNSSSFSSKISKLNLHTVMKKSARLGSRLTTTFGFSTGIKDEKFEEEANKFKIVEKTIKIFLKDLHCFIESMQEFVNTCFQVSENVATFYAEKCNQSDVEEFRTCQRLLKTEHWEAMKNALELHVINILKQLLSRFQNPIKLIEKRNDKLLDYDAATKKVESNKDPSKQRSLKEEQIMAKNNYEALNAQLLDELPLFTARTVEIIQGCVHAQIKIKKLFLAKITEEMMKLLDLPSMLGSSPLNSTSVFETFQIKYNLIVDQMVKDFELIPVNLFPNATVTGFSRTLDRRSSRDCKNTKGSSTLLRKSSVISEQGETDRYHIENNFKGHVYRVNRNYETTEVAGLSVRKDDLVGVIKYKDPSGNCHRWFVDNGTEKGFIPENVLSPCPGTIGPGNNFDTLPKSNGLTELNLLSSSTSNHVQRSNSSCSSSSSNTNATIGSLGSSSNRTITRPAPRPPNSSIQRAESFSIKAPAPPPPLPPRSTSIDAGIYYDPVSKEGMASFYQNLAQTGRNSVDYGSARYSNIDEFDPLVSQIRQNSSPIEPHRYEDIENIPEERYENLDTIAATNLNDRRTPINETWKAAYPFNPKGPYQVSLSRGAPVLVLHKSDLNGNSEWWFIRNHLGSEGYVPANYLTSDLH